MSSLSFIRYRIKLKQKSIRSANMGEIRLQRFSHRIFPNTITHKDKITSFNTTRMRPFFISIMSDNF
jgi:hypothetical protein